MRGLDFKYSQLNKIHINQVGVRTLAPCGLLLYKEKKNMNKQDIHETEKKEFTVEEAF